MAVVQTDVALKYRLLMLLWSDIVMGSQKRLCAQCVTKGLCTKKIYFVTAKGMLQQLCMCVHIVRKDFSPSVTWKRI